MAMKLEEETVEITAETPAEFPVTLAEFASGAQPAGSVRAFVATMKESGDLQPRLLCDWRALFSRFMAKPVGVGWQTWRETKQGGIR